MAMRIGQYLKRLTWNDPNVASDRIRGEWVMRCCSEMEVWRPGAAYDAVIFHNAVPLIDQTKATVKILDVCDPMWTNCIDEFRSRVQSVDGIVTATEELRRQLAAVISKPVRVIGDGHDLEFYSTNRRPNPHAEQAKVAVWFGYADNAASLRAFFPILAKFRLRLKIIAERNPFPGLSMADYLPWKLETFVRQISEADFALLPTVQPYKSNNKDISALLSGIPIAKTTEAVCRFMDPAERQKEMAKAPEIIAKHDVRDRAQEYLGWIRELAQAKTDAGGDITLYTAICGKYDKDRTDVRVFRDKRADKFIEPVMNAKVYKVLPHKFIDSPLRIWMDGNIKPRKGAATLIRELLGEDDIAVFKHPVRKCVYEEYAPARLRLAPHLQALIDDQVARYKADGMPKDFGLAECGVILSRANGATREFFERWWAEISRYSSRDQVSFPYVWWTMRDRIRVRLVGPCTTRFGEWFEYVTR